MCITQENSNQIRNESQLRYIHTFFSFFFPEPLQANCVLNHKHIISFNIKRKNDEVLCRDIKAFRCAALREIYYIGRYTNYYNYNILMYIRTFPKQTPRQRRRQFLSVFTVCAVPFPNYPRSGVQHELTPVVYLYYLAVIYSPS